MVLLEKFFAEIASLYSKTSSGILIGTTLTWIPSLELPLLKSLSAMGPVSAQAKDLFLPDMDEDIEFLDLGRNFRSST